MSEKKPPSQVYTLPLSYVDEIVAECGVQISITSDLLRDLLDETSQFHNKKTVIPMIAELLWINNSILRKINIEVDPPAFYHNKDTDEDEYLLTETSILDLQILMISRFMAINELNRFSLSICEN